MMPSIDLYAEAFKRNPHPFYAAMREAAPVYHYQHPDGFPSWLILRYQDGEMVLRDHRRFRKDLRNALPTEQLAQLPPDPEIFTLMFSHMLNQDPPIHTRLRSLVSKAFTPRLINQLQNKVQAVADSLLQEVQSAGRMDLIDDFAFPLPIIVICDLLGIPNADRQQFRIWSDATIRPSVSAEERATLIQLMAEFADYLRHLSQQRQAKPQADLFSALLAVEIDGDHLTETELFSMITLLLVAGHETTVNLIGNGMAALLSHPDQYQLLQENPTLVAAAVEEFIRYDGPVERTPPYWVAEEVELAGHTIPRGHLVEVVLAAANRDPAVFADPDRLLLTRTDNKHLGFGFGLHYCLGAPLARLEGQIAFTTLLQRLPKLRLAVTSDALQWRAESIFLRGLRSLPVEWR